MKSLGVSIVLAAAGAACGQAGWIITPEYAPGHTSVNPLAPSVRIVVSAYFPPSDYAFAGASWGLVAGDSTWVAGYHPPPMSNPTGPYAVDGRRISGMQTGQLNFPPANIYADPRNPIPVYVADWITDDFSPRSVEIGTERTRRFDAYPSRSSSATQSRLSMVVEETVLIQVTPAPSGAAIFAAAGLAALRRSRGAR